MHRKLRPPIIARRWADRTLKSRCRGGWWTPTATCSWWTGNLHSWSRLREEAGVDRLICVGVDPATSARSLEMADSIAGVFATAGMHPHDAELFDTAAGARIEELLHDPRVVAVGECGLDFYRMRSAAEDQIRALKAHIALSNESAKPMVVHVRDAWPDVLRVLDEGSAERVVIHCFSGDATIARSAPSAGTGSASPGNVTYPKNEHLRQAARAVDIDRHPRRDRLTVPRPAEASRDATTNRRTSCGRSPSSRGCATRTSEPSRRPLRGTRTTRSLGSRRRLLARTDVRCSRLQ